jgi:predicted small integral membrane protein
MFDWMVWTFPVAVFFTVIGLLLVVMTCWEIKSPSPVRRGFLPLATSRGDRLFIGLLGAAYIHLVFLAVAGWLAGLLGMSEEPSIWYAFGIACIWMMLVMIRG